MRIVIPEGTGQVGRSPVPAPWRVDRWDPLRTGDWVRAIDSADAVINLAGRSVNCRYSRRNRREILGSRVDSTRIIGQVIAGARRPPATWLQASTPTIVGYTDVLHLAPALAGSALFVAGPALTAPRRVG